MCLKSEAIFHIKPKKCLKKTYKPFFSFSLLVLLSLSSFPNYLV